MADFADQAQNVTELHINKAIKDRETATLPFSGVCIACQEPVTDRRYCDSFCREDHEQSMKERFIR
jgi:hypothetical protein